MQILKKSGGLKVAVVGATGAVGRELLKILEEREFPVRELETFASLRSQGKPILFKGGEVRCKVLKGGCFDGTDIVFFDASDAVSREWVPQAVASGAWVIDNSATFRLDTDVLLLVPEVNGDLLVQRLVEKKNFTARERILSGPNCSTVQMVIALRPLRDHWGLRRVVVSTYQSTSGAGTAAMEELARQTGSYLDQKSFPPSAFAHQIAFNCIPHIGGFKEDGSTSEEQKIIGETRKLLGIPNLGLSATAVRVPTFSCHGESVNVECERSFELLEVRQAFDRQPGLVVQDDPTRNIYPMGNTAEDSVVQKAGGRDLVYIGRIRRDPSVNNGINFWIVSDNLRKGAALNAVQIAELLLEHIK